MLTLAELQNETDSKSVAGGGIVTLPPGTVELTGTYFLRDGVSVIGAGAGVSKLRLAAGVNKDAVGNDTVVSDISLAGFEIDGNKASNPTGGHNLRLGHGFSNVSLFDIYSHDASLHGVITKDDATDNSGLRVDNLRSHNNGVNANGSGLYLNRTFDAKITALSANGNSLDGYQWKGGSSLATDISCVSNHRFGMFFTDGGVGTVESFEVGGSSLGIMIQKGNSSSTLAMVSTGEVYGCSGDGVQVDGVQECNVRGVRSFGNSEAGLSLVNGARWNRITDCAMTANGYGLMGRMGTSAPDQNLLTAITTRANLFASFQKNSWGTGNVVTALLEL